jgi:hypothetical protein
MILIYLGLFAVVVYLLFNGRKQQPIKKLTQQSAKWATMAQQDESPIVAVLHANYAVGYLWALKDIASPSDVNRETGINIKQFEEHIINVQSMVTKRIIKQCPELAGEIDLYLSSIAES